MNYKIEIPKLSDSDYHCPCHEFVKQTGQCTCHNLKSERDYDPRGCDIIVSQRTKFILPAANGSVIYVEKASSGRRTKSLEEMRLDHPSSYYVTHGGEPKPDLEDDEEDLALEYAKVKRRIKQ